MPFNNAIGGIAQDWGNTIAHWGRNGVRISRLNDANGAPSPRNAILGNSIFGNGALGWQTIAGQSLACYRRALSRRASQITDAP